MEYSDNFIKVSEEDPLYKALDNLSLNNKKIPDTNSPEIEIYNNTELELLDNIKKIIGNKRYVVQYNFGEEQSFNNNNSLFITLQNKENSFFSKILEGATRRLFEGEAMNYDITSSDSWESAVGYDKIKSINVYLVKDPKYTSDLARFDYINISEHDLSRYQIYKATDKHKDNSNCLLFALKSYGVNLDNLLTGLGNDNKLFRGKIPKGLLSKVASSLKIKIRIVRILKNNKRDYEIYGNEGQQYEIAVYLDHAFILEKTEVRYGRNVRMDSLTLIDKLFKEGKFVKDESIYFDAKNESEITFDIKDQELITLKKIKTKKDTIQLFADTEAYFDEESNHHPLLFTCVDQNNNFIRERTFKGLLENIYKSYNKQNKSIRMYYHNLKYDWFLIRNCESYKLIDITEKSGMYYSIQIMYFGMQITLCDSYKLISKKLSDFASFFGLEEGKKEYIMYKLYNNLTKDKTYLDIKDKPELETKVYYDENCKEIVKPKDLSNYIYCEHVAFPKSIIDEINKQGNYIKFNKYRHIQHYQYYLDFDCTTLRDGLNVFRKQMLDILDEDCFKTLTISSLVHNNALKSGAYEGVYNVFGGLQSFIQKACFGGRVATKDNKKQKVEGFIQDFDGVSLYPSAIDRLCKEMGFPIGKAKEIKNINDFTKKMNSKSHYIVEIIALKDTKYQQIAFPCITKEDGGREYTNKIAGRTLIVDKITLEDWVKYCGLEYVIVRGIYWNNGYNNKMGLLVKNLFDRRVKCKKDMKLFDIKSNEYKGLNCKQEMLKLCLNSLYGKTMIKRPDSKRVIRDKKDFTNYLVKNYSIIKEFEHHGSNTIFKCEEFSYDHKNTAHIGGMILSMSKRIMNEVMSTAEDINVNILYQDTDSMHIVSDKDNEPIKRLELEYKNRYNKDLVGDNFGQFHCDFAPPKGSSRNILPYSELSIILGKKAYYDRVVSFDDNGNKIIDQHFRMKGASKISICQKEIKIKNNDNTESLKSYNNIEEKYLDLYKGEQLGFNLACVGAVSFRLGKHGINSREEFNRWIKFN